MKIQDEHGACRIQKRRKLSLLLAIYFTKKNKRKQKIEKISRHDIIYYPKFIARKEKEVYKRVNFKLCINLNIVAPKHCLKKKIRTKLTVVLH